MGSTDNNQLYVSNSVSQGQGDELGSKHRKTLHNESSVNADGLSQEGASNTRVFKLEFNDRMTKMLQEGVLLSLEKVGPVDF